jgi:hypothetical protein
VLVHFLTDLHDKGNRADFVARALTAVQHVFLEEGCNQRAFSSRLVTDTRDACRRSLAESKPAAAAAGITTKAPVTLAQILYMLANVGKKPLDARSVDDFIMVAACIVANDCFYSGRALCSCSATESRDALPRGEQSLPSARAPGCTRGRSCAH